MSRFISRFIKPVSIKTKSEKLEYNLEAMGGESIEKYVDRLLKHFKDVQHNKVAAYAQFVSGKRSVVTGEFNGVNIKIDEKSTKKEIIDEIKSKLSMRSEQNQEYKPKKGFGKK
jgi:hypothetical protein